MSPWWLLVPAPAPGLLAADALARSHDDLWRDIALGCLLALSGSAARRMHGRPSLAKGG